MLYSVDLLVRDPMELDYTVKNYAIYAEHDRNLLKLKNCDRITLGKVKSVIGKAENPLFIVGNGFDCHHKLHTKYTDFREYIRKNDPKLLKSLKESFGFKDKDEHIWRDFEAVIAKCITIPYNQNVAPSAESKDTPASELIEKLDYINTDLSKQIHEWTGSVEKEEIPYVDKNLVEDGLFNDNSLILTYNYSNTIEKLYHVNPSQIFHIHGRYDEHDNAEDGLCIGFCDLTYKILDNYQRIVNYVFLGDEFREINIKSKPTELLKISDADQTKLFDYFTSRNKVSYIQNNQLYEFNTKILNKLSKVDVVVVLGHSLSACDAYTLMMLRDRLSKDNVKWYLGNWERAGEEENSCFNKVAMYKMFLSPDNVNSFFW